MGNFLNKIEKMTDSEVEEVQEADPLPANRVRFTDMSKDLVDKAIRICEEATSKCKLDKDLATEIQTKIKEDEDLKDETAGWHVITGKSFASAITYKTTCVLFFDLLDGHHKSFLMFKTQ